MATTRAVAGHTFTQAMDPELLRQKHDNFLEELRCLPEDFPFNRPDLEQLVFDTSHELLVEPGSRSPSKQGFEHSEEREWPVGSKHRVSVLAEVDFSPRPACQLTLSMRGLRFTGYRLNLEGEAPRSANRFFSLLRRQVDFLDRLPEIALRPGSLSLWQTAFRTAGLSARSAPLDKIVHCTFLLEASLPGFAEFVWARWVDRAGGIGPGPTEHMVGAFLKRHHPDKLVIVELSRSPSPGRLKHGQAQETSRDLSPRRSRKPLRFEE